MADEHIGKEILICTDEGKFYGTIHSIDAQNRKLILQKGEHLTLRNVLLGCFVYIDLVYDFCLSIKSKFFEQCPEHSC